MLTSDTGTGTGVRRILINEYTYRDAAAYADGDMGGIHNAWGGRSELGNSTRRNNISISGGLYSNIYGGYTRGAGTTAADKNDSHDNTVSVTGDTTPISMAAILLLQRAEPMRTLSASMGTP